MPGLVDNAHAAVAEHGLDFVAGDGRQAGAACRGSRASGAGPVPGRREQRLELRLDDAQLVPALANLGQQLGAIAADLFRSPLRVQYFVEQALHTRLVGHRSDSMRGRMDG